MAAQVTEQRCSCLSATLRSRIFLQCLRRESSEIRGACFCWPNSPAQSNALHEAGESPGAVIHRLTAHRAHGSGFARFWEHR